MSHRRRLTIAPPCPPPLRHRHARCSRCAATLTVVAPPHPQQPRACRCCTATHAFAAPPRSRRHVCPIVMPPLQQPARRRCVLVATAAAVAVAVRSPLARRRCHRACRRRRAATSAVVELLCSLSIVAAAQGLRPRAPILRAIVRVPPDHAELPGHAEPPCRDVPGRRCRACRRRRATMSAVVALLCLLSSVCFKLHALSSGAAPFASPASTCDFPAVRRAKMSESADFRVAARSSLQCRATTASSSFTARQAACARARSSSSTGGKRSSHVARRARASSSCSDLSLSLLAGRHGPKHPAPPLCQGQRAQRAAPPVPRGLSRRPDGTPRRSAADRPLCVPKRAVCQRRAGPSTGRTAPASRHPRKHRGQGRAGSCPGRRHLGKVCPRYPGKVGRRPAKLAAVLAKWSPRHPGKVGRRPAKWPLSRQS